MTEQPYPRDLVGYGPNPPDPRWPNKARLALQIVLNYEEGGENSVLHGDKGSEVFLTETPGGSPVIGARAMSTESVYEYGSRAGFWRLHRLFTERGLPITIYGVGMALMRHPDATRAMKAAGWEIASHSWRWIDYQNVPPEVERAHMAECIKIQNELLGERPLGWYTGRVSPQTRRLVVEEGGFLYDADSYADDLPYWNHEFGRPHLVVPYTLDNNDMRFGGIAGFTSGDQFYNYLTDAFDTLYAEGAYAPKMMSVGLHCRLAGRPGRFKALQRFLDHVQKHPDVWICRRIDIARHWHAEHPAAR